MTQQNARGLATKITSLWGDDMTVDVRKDGKHYVIIATECLSGHRERITSLREARDLYEQHN